MFIDTYQAIIIAGYLLVMCWTAAGFGFHPIYIIYSSVQNRWDNLKISKLGNNLILLVYGCNLCLAGKLVKPNYGTANFSWKTMIKLNPTWHGGGLKQPPPKKCSKCSILMLQGPPQCLETFLRSFENLRKINFWVILESLLQLKRIFGHFKTWNYPFLCVWCFTR